MVKGFWERIINGPQAFVIAEAGVNHNGSLHLAQKLVDAAVKAGASAVKFQTFIPHLLASEKAPKARYQQKAVPKAESQLAMLKKLTLSFDDYRRLADYCRKRGIIFLSTAFDATSADFLNELGVVLFKIPSGEITNLPLLQHVASKGKPVILSTGMSTLAEIRQAVAVLRAGTKKIALLHCVSSYPTPFDQVNLRAMQALGKVFKLPVGFSDHTLGIEMPIAAAALGAQIIEKHFTLDPRMHGPDHAMSLDPCQLTAMVKAIKHVGMGLGDGKKRRMLCEENTARVARRSLVAAQDISKGQVISREMLSIKRPGNGIPPSAIKEIIGRKALRTIKREHLINYKDLQ